MEDIDLGIRKLVEIALRAISPAINDPNTAKNCIEEIGIILSKLAKHKLPSSYLTDDENKVRIILGTTNLCRLFIQKLLSIKALR